MTKKRRFTIAATLLAFFSSPLLSADEDCDAFVTAKEYKLCQTVKALQEQNQKLVRQLEQMEKRLVELEDGMPSPSSPQWHDLYMPSDWRNLNAKLYTPSDWRNYAPKCRLTLDGWIEFRGILHTPPISGWPAAEPLLLPPNCRPRTVRPTEMPCLAGHTPTVCNNDFHPDGRVRIHSDLSVSQQRFEGVRIWGR
jgi:hypothetical protein